MDAPLSSAVSVRIAPAVDVAANQMRVAIVKPDAVPLPTPPVAATGMTGGSPNAQAGLTIPVTVVAGAPRMSRGPRLEDIDHRPEVRATETIVARETREAIIEVAMNRMANKSEPIMVDMIRKQAIRATAITQTTILKSDQNRPRPLAVLEVHLG